MTLSSAKKAKLTQPHQITLRQQLGMLSKRVAKRTNPTHANCSLNTDRL